MDAYRIIKPIKIGSHNSLSNGVQNASNVFFGNSSGRYQPYRRYPALRVRREISHQRVGYYHKNQHFFKHHISTRLDLYTRIVKYLTA